MACRRVIARSASVAAYELLGKILIGGILRLRDAWLALWYSLAMKKPRRAGLWAVATCLGLAAQIHKLRIRLGQLLDYIIIQLDGAIWPAVRRRAVLVGGSHSGRGGRSYERLRVCVWQTSFTSHFALSCLQDVSLAQANPRDKTKMWWWDGVLADHGVV